MSGVTLRQRLAVVVLCAGQLMIVLDGTVVNVALPSIQRTLGFSQPDLAWVVNSYLIAFAGFLLLAGRVGDLVGRKRVFISGLIVFTVASLACGLASSQVALIVARFVQGVGGAICSSVILGMLVTEFPEPRRRAAVIGVYTLVASTGGSIGLLTGGAVTQAINWHWIFFINLPIGVAALTGGLALLDERPSLGLRQGVDVLGAVLITSGLMLAVFAIVSAGSYGWGSMRTISTGVGAIGIMAAFVRCEARSATPLVPLGLLRSRDLSSSNMIRGLLVGAVTGQFFIGVLLMERVLHYGAVTTGLAFVPLTLTLGGLAVGVTARLVTRIGPKATMLPGIAAVAAGLVLLSGTPAHAGYVGDLLPGILLLGIGQGIGFLPTITVAMRDSTPDDSGLRSGIVNLSQQMGAALGVAIAASVAAGRTRGLLAGGASLPSALLGGYHLAYAVMAGIVTLALAATAALVPSGVGRYLHPSPAEPVGVEPSGLAVVAGAGITAHPSSCPPASAPGADASLRRECAQRSGCCEP